MTVAQTGAASHKLVEGWHDLDWKAIQHNVRRLQARIVKATKEKRWSKVKALQRLLTHSFSGKALAVKRVTENQGKNTPGVDKVTWNTPQKKATAIASLRQGRSTADAIAQCFTRLSKKNKPQWILEGDIKACLDRIDQ